jgi:DNA-binding transcriptional LysR family regulator
MQAPLDSELLRTFVAIVDTGSFTRAGEAVHRTQSAISMQVKRLEGTLGQPLFTRGQRGVALTPTGESLLTNARRILKLLEATAADLAAPEATGTVRIGIPEEYGARLLPNVLARFAETYPRIEVSVRCEASEGYGAALDDDELDIAVMSADPSDLCGEALLDDPIVWVTSERHIVHEDDPLPLAVFERGCWWRDLALDSLDRAGRSYRMAYSSASVAGIQAAVTSGLAVAVLGRSTVPEGARLLAPRDGFPELPSANIVLRRKAGHPSRAVEYMTDAIKDAFRARLGRAAN